MSIECLFRSFIETFLFSTTRKSRELKIFFDLKVKSSRFPIGVGII